MSKNVWWVLLVAAACASGCDAKKSEPKSDDDKAADESDDEPKEKKKKKKPKATASATTATASAVAPATASAAAPAPETLATMFDGGPSPAVKMNERMTFGRASIQLPDGWKQSSSWENVDSIRRKDDASVIVILRLDVSDGLLDANVATWTKVPFGLPEDIKWQPREPGKLGAAHLDAKIAQGSGKMFKDDAELWQVATAYDGKKYGLVVLAGTKKNAPPEARAETIAAVRSVEWK